MGSWLGLRGLGGYLDALGAEGTHIDDEGKILDVPPSTAACSLGPGDILGTVAGSAA